MVDNTGTLNLEDFVRLYQEQGPYDLIALLPDLETFSEQTIVILPGIELGGQEDVRYAPLRRTAPPAGLIGRQRRQNRSRPFRHLSWNPEPAQEGRKRA